MAASQIRSNGSSHCKDDLHSTVDEKALLGSYLEAATDNLLFREFDTCIKNCRKIVSLAKTGCAGAVGADDCVEKAAVLTIQAYAERNEWQNVVPYVQGVFGSIEACPASVIQLCLLLHAKVREYMQCHAIAKVWLNQRPRPGQEASYSQVAKVYIRNILTPLGAYNLIPQFVEGCPGLSDQEKGDLLTPSPSKPSTPVSPRRRFPSASAREYPSGKSGSASLPEEQRAGGGRVSVPRPNKLETKGKEEGSRWPYGLETVRHIIRWILSIPLLGLSKVLVAVAIAIAAFMQVQTGDGFLDSTRVITVWQILGKLWQSLFGPVRSMR